MIVLCAKNVQSRYLLPHLGAAFRMTRKALLAIPAQWGFFMILSNTKVLYE